MSNSLGREIINFFLADREGLLNSRLSCYHGIVDVIDFNQLNDLEEEMRYDFNDEEVTEEDILRYELYGGFDPWCQLILHVRRLDFIRRNYYDLVSLPYFGLLLYLGAASFFYIISYFPLNYSLWKVFPYAILISLFLFLIKVGYVLYLDNIYYRELKLMAKELEFQESEYRKIKNIEKDKNK